MANGATNRRQDILRSTSIAVAIESDFQELEASISSAEAHIALNDQLSSMFGPEEGIGKFIITIPPMISRYVDRLHWLGDPAGPAMLQLIAQIVSFNESLKPGPNYINFSQSLEKIRKIKETIPVARKRIGDITGNH